MDTSWWQGLTVLDALCQAGTMVAAARGLGIDKATVSRRIAELERSAPAPLFERRCGVVELTPYGERALMAFREHERSRRRLVAELEAKEPDIQGNVRVTTAAFFACTVITPALREFLTTHPRIAVQVEGTNRVLDLTRDEADVAVRNLRPTHGGMSVRRVGRLGLAFYASTHYLEGRPEPADRDGLGGHDVVSYDTGHFGGPGFEWFPRAARQARVTFRANDALALREAACAGLGLAVLPHAIGDAAPELRRVHPLGEGAVDIWIVTRSEQRRVRRVRAVVQFLAELVRSQQDTLYNPH